jgi:hypothetical protein
LRCSSADCGRCWRGNKSSFAGSAMELCVTRSRGGMFLATDEHRFSQIFALDLCSSGKRRGKPVRSSEM